jgi:Icc protein
MHHHPLPMGSAWLDGVALRDAAAFLEVIDAHPQVRGVLWGHVHQASDRQRGAVRFLSTPSTCSQFLPDSEFFALDGRPPGLRWLMLHPDGGIDTELDWAPSGAEH